MTAPPTIPTFVVVGQPNEGKTTVMATLAENDAAQISPVPGTTTHRQRYAVRVNGEEALVFWDTPGFESSAAALEWFKTHEDLAANMAQKFVDAFEKSGEMVEECEILKPIAEGAAVIYVVDASRPVRPVDRQQVEMLRRCGNPRIGIINSKNPDAVFLSEWQRLLGTDFNHRHEFNAHRATFQDRIELLQAIRAVIPEWKKPMDRTIAALEEDWRGRMAAMTDLLIDFLMDLVSLRHEEPIRHPGDKERASREAQDGLRESIRRKEVEFRKSARAVFHHSRDQWALDPLLEADLFSEEVWRFLGLTKGQLVLSGAMVGATIGGLIDLKLAGTSFLMGLVIGSASGAVIAWMSADKATEIETPEFKVWRIRIKSRKLGGIKAAARINPQSNLIFILLDRLLLYTQAISTWSHGRRQEKPVVTPAKEAKAGPVSSWSREERAKVSKFVGLAVKNDSEKREQVEHQLRAMLMEKLSALAANAG